MPVSRIVALALTTLATMLAGMAVPVHAAQNQAQPPAPVDPYFAPPFRHDCTVHRFGEGEAPDLSAYPDDPLCVEYAKRDITLDNGGAVRFLLAEPARFAIALPKCAYWQQDHWSVQVSRGDVPLIRWDGSYWFDKGTGSAAARLRGLTIGGQPATLRQAAHAVAPYSPELAQYFRRYSRHGDGGGYHGRVPFDPRCAQ